MADTKGTEIYYSVLIRFPFLDGLWGPVKVSYVRRVPLYVQTRLTSTKSFHLHTAPLYLVSRHVHVQYLGNSSLPALP